MKTDLYTKVVLTIIALCLIWVCVREVSVSRTAYAQGGQPVSIVGIKGGLIIPVGIAGIDRYPATPWDPLPVSETTNPLPVSVVPNQSGGQ